MSDSADPVTAGTSYTYTVAYDGFQLWDGAITLSGAAASVTAVTTSNPALSCTVATATYVPCTASPVINTPGTITLTVTPSAAGTVTATARLANCCVDYYGSQSTTIDPPGTDLAVGLTAQPHLGILVPYLRYTATITNNGPAATTSVTLTATLPAGKTATGLPVGCSSTPGSVTCTYGAIATGSSASSTFNLPLNILSLGDVTVTATRTASTPADTTPGNDSDSASCTVVSIVLATCP
ncbi:hypothetical protein ACFYUK_25135 [Nonomuraea wenchangensis]